MFPSIVDRLITSDPRENTKMPPPLSGNQTAAVRLSVDEQRKNKVSNSLQRGSLFQGTTAGRWGNTKASEGF